MRARGPRSAAAAFTAGLAGAVLCVGGLAVLAGSTGVLAMGLLAVSWVTWLAGVALTVRVGRVLDGLLELATEAVMAGEEVVSAERVAEIVEDAVGMDGAARRASWAVLREEAAHGSQG